MKKKETVVSVRKKILCGGDEIKKMWDEQRAETAPSTFAWTK